MIYKPIKHDDTRFAESVIANQMLEWRANLEPTASVAAIDWHTFGAAAQRLSARVEDDAFTLYTPAGRILIRGDASVAKGVIRFEWDSPTPMTRADKLDRVITAAQVGAISAETAKELLDEVDTYGEADAPAPVCAQSEPSEPPRSLADRVGEQLLESALKACRSHSWPDAVQLVRTFIELHDRKRAFGL